MKNKLTINGFSLACASLLLAAGLCSCDNYDRTKEYGKSKIKDNELILQTKHCRYYCLERNGYGQCKLVVCECDSGFNADASVSW